jgi:hypothetical protein
MQHGEGNSQHSKVTSATLRKITPATLRSTFATLQHGKNNGATSTHVTCNMEQNSAAFKINICNIQK